MRLRLNCFVTNLLFAMQRQMGEFMSSVKPRPVAHILVRGKDNDGPVREWNRECIDL